MPKNTAKGGGWVTINGVHVFIENGKVTKGPAKFIGSSVNDLPSGQSAEDKKAALKAKYAKQYKGDPDVQESPGTKEGRQQNKLTGRTEPVKRGSSARKSTENSEKVKTEAKKIESRLDKLEGGNVTSDSIQSALNRTSNGVTVGGYTTLKNAYGESVELSTSRFGVEARVYHSNGASSIIPAPTFETQVKGRGGRVKTVRETDYEGLANMLNDNRFHSNSPSRVKSGPYDRGMSTHDYNTARDNGTYKLPSAGASASAKANTGNSNFDSATAKTTSKATNPNKSTRSAEEILIERQTKRYLKNGYSTSEAKELAQIIVKEEIKLAGGSSTFTTKNQSAKQTLKAVHAIEKLDSHDFYANYPNGIPARINGKGNYSTADKVSKTAGTVSRTTARASSATPSAQANFNNAVSNAQAQQPSKPSSLPSGHSDSVRDFWKSMGLPADGQRGKTATRKKK